MQPGCSGRVASCPHARGAERVVAPCATVSGVVELPRVTTNGSVAVFLFSRQHAHSELDQLERLGTHDLPSSCGQDRDDASRRPALDQQQLPLGIRSQMYGTSAA